MKCFSTRCFSDLFARSLAGYGNQKGGWLDGMHVIFGRIRCTPCSFSAPLLALGADGKDSRAFEILRNSPHGLLVGGYLARQHDSSAFWMTLDSWKGLSSCT